MCKGADFAVMAEIDYDESKLLFFCLSAVSSKDCGLFFLVWPNRCGLSLVDNSLFKFYTRTYCLDWQGWQGKRVNFSDIHGVLVVFFLLPRLALVAGGGVVSLGESWVLSGLGVGGLEGFCFRYSAIARLTTTRVSWGTVKNSFSAQAPRCSISCFSR